MSLAITDSNYGWAIEANILIKKLSIISNCIYFYIEELKNIPIYLNMWVICK